MKHRLTTLVSILIALLLFSLSACGVGSTKPFSDLKAEDFASVDVLLVPPDATITITDADSLTKIADLLNDVVLYQQDDAGRETDGQLVKYTLTMDDGTVHSIGAYGDYLFYDDVCYKAKYEPSEALNAFGNSYYKELPDKGTLPEESEDGGTRTVGVSHAPATEAYEDAWGVKLTAKDITPTGLTIVCTQQDGAPTGELETGSPYALEIYQGGVWTSVKMLPQENDVAWTSEAWVIQPNDTIEWVVDWEWLYGALPDGSYRISKSVMDFRGTGDYDATTYYAGFQLITKEQTEPLKISGLHDGIYLSVPYVDGWVTLHYFDSFGVCGTGLEEHEITLANGMTAYQGAYDNHTVWDFISIRLDKGNVVSMTENVTAWWPQNESTVMEILGACEIEVD